MPLLTLSKVCFRIRPRFGMIEYVQNTNICYISVLTFHFHSKFFQEEHHHVYFINQYKEMTILSSNYMIVLAG